jgi:hypothetical protein
MTRKGSRIDTHAPELKGTGFSGLWWQPGYGQQLLDGGESGPGLTGQA